MNTLYLSIEVRYESGIQNRKSATLSSDIIISMFHIIMQQYNNVKVKILFVYQFYAIQTLKCKYFLLSMHLYNLIFL